MLESWLSRRLFLADARCVENLLTLARIHAGLPDARTTVIYEEGEYTGEQLGLPMQFEHHAPPPTSRK